MKAITIPVHSIVDVITNSSTVIYTYCTTNTITFIKEVIDSVLRAGGSDKTADDLYEFELVPNSDLVEECGWRIQDREGISSEEATQKIEAARKDGTLKDLVKESMYETWQYREELRVTPKDDNPESLDIARKVMGMFSHEAEFDG